jgi:hypothetical protein
MDAEFEDMLRRLLLPAKQVLRFSGWSAAAGPRIEAG